MSEKGLGTTILPRGLPPFSEKRAKICEGGSRHWIRFERARDSASSAACFPADGRTSAHEVPLRTLFTALSANLIILSICAMPIPLCAQIYVGSRGCMKHLTGGETCLFSQNPSKERAHFLLLLPALPRVYGGRGDNSYFVAQHSLFTI